MHLKTMAASFLRDKGFFYFLGSGNGAVIILTCIAISRFQRTGMEPNKKRLSRYSLTPWFYIIGASGFEVWCFYPAELRAPVWCTIFLWQNDNNFIYHDYVLLCI